MCVTATCFASSCNTVCHCVIRCITITQISDEEVKQRIDKLTEELDQNHSLTEVGIAAH